MSTSGDWPGPLAAAAEFAPDPGVVRRTAALPRWPDVSGYGALLTTARLAAVCPGMTFVRQWPRPRRRPAIEDTGPGYNESILAGRVPTRMHSWHDLFNGFIWAAMPAAKLAIHGRQHGFIAARPASSGPTARSRVEDTLAMIDEGGLLLAVAPPQADSLAARVEAGEQEFINDAIDAGEVRPVVFGHALLEHLGRGQPARGFPVVVAVERLDDLGAIDDALASLVPSVSEPGGRPGLRVRAWTR